MQINKYCIYNIFNMYIFIYGTISVPNDFVYILFLECINKWSALNTAENMARKELVTETTHDDSQKGNVIASYL